MKRAVLAVPILLFASACVDEPQSVEESITGPSFSHSTVDDLCCHDQWTSQGTFTAVVASSPGAIYSGLNTNFLSWGFGLPDQSSARLIEFDNTTRTGNFPTSGVLLSFSHQNGVIAFFSAIDGGEFTIDLSACDFAGTLCVPSGPVLEVMTVAFDVISTPNTSDPIASADGLIFPDLPKNIWVLEGETTSFEILYQQRSPIEIIDIRATSPGGFVSVGNAPIPVIQVDIDVKPGSDRNPINPAARGRVPVAFRADSWGFPICRASVEA